MTAFSACPEQSRRVQRTVFSKKQFAIGVDFGATQIKVGIVDRGGKVFSREILATPKRISPEEFVQIISSRIQLLKGNAFNRTRWVGIGVGVPGLVDHEQGRVEYLVNVKGWRKVPLGGLLESKTQIPVSLDNDVNAMTLGELVFGAGRGCRNLICLTLGTGVGGGMVIAGRLYRGASGAAGEIGHLIIEQNGKSCACGSRGCLEAYVGNQRIIELATEKLRRGGVTSLLQTWIQYDQPLSPQLISRAANQKDPIALSVWKEIGTHLGVALASVVNLINPEKIIIGGGVAEAGEILFHTIRKTVRERAMKGPADSVSIVNAELGENAGIIGAAVLAGIKRRNLS